MGTNNIVLGRKLLLISSVPEAFCTVWIKYDNRIFTPEHFALKLLVNMSCISWLEIFRQDWLRCIPKPDLKFFHPGIWDWSCWAQRFIQTWIWLVRFSKCCFTEVFGIRIFFSLVSWPILKLFLCKTIFTV